MSWEVALKVEGRLLGAMLAALISQNMRRRLEGLCLDDDLDLRASPKVCAPS